MFPHLPGGPPRGDERLGWLAFWALNVGLALRAIGEPLAALRPTPMTGVLLPLAAALLILAMLTCPRVRAFAGRHESAGR